MLAKVPGEPFFLFGFLFEPRAFLFENDLGRLPVTAGNIPIVAFRILYIIQVHIGNA